MSNTPAEPTRSIAQTSRMLRSIIESETLEHYFWVGGRIERCFLSDRGHYYFDLVDDKSRIRCMLHENRRAALPFDLETGLEIVVYGDVQFYEASSQVQIQVRDARLLAPAAFVKPASERLRDEGMYPPRRIEPPARLRRVACITGRSSRAIGDFETAYQSAGERAVLAPLSWQYVLLEGERALGEIVDAIRALDATEDVDAIALIRGGGRGKDFAPFNSYEVAKAICQCRTYLVTGIGHHRDQALADQVADHSASTPTAAAHHLASLCLRSSQALEFDFLPSPAQTARDPVPTIFPSLTSDHLVAPTWNSAAASKAETEILSGDTEPVRATTAPPIVMSDVLAKQGIPAPTAFNATGMSNRDDTQPMKASAAQPIGQIAIAILALAVVAAALILFVFARGF